MRFSPLIYFVLAFHRGNYDTFVSARTERLKNQQREYEAQKDYRDHIQVCLENQFLIPGHVRNVLASEYE